MFLIPHSPWTLILKQSPSPRSGINDRRSNYPFDELQSRLSRIMWRVAVRTLRPRQWLYLEEACSALISPDFLQWWISRLLLSRIEAWMEVFGGVRQTAVRAAVGVSLERQSEKLSSCFDGLHRCLSSLKSGGFPTSAPAPLTGSRTWEQVCSCVIIKDRGQDWPSSCDWWQHGGEQPQGVWKSGLTRIWPHCLPLRKKHKDLHNQIHAKTYKHN